MSISGIRGSVSGRSNWSNDGSKDLRPHLRATDAAAEQTNDPGRMWMKRAHAIRDHATYLVGCAFLVSAIAFINRYPLVYSDSGAYIEALFTLRPVADRPIGYALIMRAVTWQSTLWTVVLFQGGMMAWLLYEALRQVLPSTIDIKRVHLPLLVVLMVCTSMPWYMAQIMPDAMTPMLAVILFLLLHGEGLAVFKRAFLWACLFFFLISHNAHVAMSFLFLGLSAAVLLVRRSFAGRYWMAWSGVLLTTFGGVFFVAQYNGAHGMRAEFSPASNVFLSGKLCEGALLRDFLHERCPEVDYALCPYRDDLPKTPGAFIWGDTSIVSRMGGDLQQVDALLAPTVHDLLSDPEYLGRYVRMALVASVTQFFQVNTNSGILWCNEGSAPYSAVKKHLPWEESMYITSLQAYNSWWNLGTMDQIVHVAILLSLVVIWFCWPKGKDQVKLRALVTVLLAWVVLNAIVTASLANVYDRLQSRVAWLIVLAACLVLLKTTLGERMVRKFAMIERRPDQSSEPNQA